MHQVRRGVESDAQSGRLQRRGSEGAGGALAVGACHVQHGGAQVRVSEQRQGREHAVLAELDPDVAADEEQLLEILERHLLPA
jgi:hypothetical protein